MLLKKSNTEYVIALDCPYVLGDQHTYLLLFSVNCNHVMLSEQTEL